MSNAFTVALIQVTAGRRLAPNIETACRLAREARSMGAQMALMPENVAMMEWGRANILAKSMPEDRHEGLSAFRALARETGLWLHAGSLAIRLEGEMVANRSYFIKPDGEVAATYDKIHMFDVDLGGGESYRESATFLPGDRAVLAHTPWGGLGMTICYDLRFPHLFRALAKAGASFLCVPAAFTQVTGQAHWHVLLRARAIETGCFVFAPAQCGAHENGRQTYGHSLVVDPWGEVMADGGETPGVILAKIDPAKIAEARGKVPALTHDRVFALPDSD